MQRRGSAPPFMRDKTGDDRQRVGTDATSDWRSLATQVEPERARESDQSRRDTLVLAAIVVWSCAMVVFAIARGARHDYVAYLRMWSLVRAGGNPWGGGAGNTYGPLHNAFAYLEPFDLGPKLIMVIAFLAVNFLLLWALLKTNPSNSTLWCYVIFVPANLLVIDIVGSYGLNDSLAAAFIGVAILARLRRQFLLVGVFIALAALLKYYPALLVPFFCLDRRRFELKPLLAAACTAVVGLLLTLAVWGDGFVDALRHGADRDPKLLSVLASWDSHPELYGHSRIANFLLENNAPVVLLACACVFVLAYLMRLSWIESSTIGALTYLLTYKVGHAQYFLPLMFLCVGLLIVGTARSMWLAYCFLPFVVFLSLYQLGYEWLTDAYFETAGFVRWNVGFVAFGLGCATIIAFIAGVRMRPQTLGRDDATTTVTTPDRRTGFAW